MASLNKVMLIGNLGKDPELKYTPSGHAVVTFPMATTRRWKDKDGNRQEDTQWHNVKMWGRRAEVLQQYVKKGDQLFVEGRIETRTYDDKDGNRKWFTEVVVENFEFFGSRRGDSGGGDYTGPQTAPDYDSQPQPSTPMGGEDDDLPF
ncbi:MAG: single-stranded DNA-binding protein [Candidatus Zixiibacteriota bacterium]